MHSWLARYEGDGLEGLGDVVEAVLPAMRRAGTRLSGSWPANRANAAHPAVAVRLQIDNRKKSPSPGLLTADAQCQTYAEPDYKFA